MAINYNHPFLRFLLNIYFQVRPLRIKELLQGTKAWEDYWINRKTGKDWHWQSKDWIEGYWKSIDHPHRKLLVDAVAEFNPKSILEVGCASGPNLYLLAKKYPEADIWGVDINRQAVEYGREMFFKEGIRNVRLATGRADALLFNDNTFDVVITDAVLIYVGPDRIWQTLGRMMNIAKKGIVLVERSVFKYPFKSVYLDGMWQRNYHHIFTTWVLGGKPQQVNFKKITKDIWPEWSETGYVISVRK